MGVHMRGLNVWTLFVGLAFVLAGVAALVFSIEFFGHAEGILFLAVGVIVLGVSAVRSWRAG